METPVDQTDAWFEECFRSPGSIQKIDKKHSSEEETWCPTKHCGEHKENRMASKPHSTPLTLKWLSENYEVAEGVCIPRSTLYVHYLDFCDHNDSQPVNAASFGKIIRQQFPHLTTRRLGTRGQSKYHYYGIGVKETSNYYDIVYSRKGVLTSNKDKKATSKSIAYSPRCKLGTLLPEFPDVKDLKLSGIATADKVSTFLMMYRTHCQRILDTVIGANFDDVQSFLLHFWQGMPGHIVPILGTPLIISLVGVCDSILYKVVCGVLMPTVLQPLPDSLTQVITGFAQKLDEWLRPALLNLPDALVKMKFDVARQFAQVLKRQTSLNHLCQASRTVIYNSGVTSQMVDDWSHVDIASICKQTLYTMERYTHRDYALIVSLYHEFEMLMDEQAPIDAYTEWLDSMVNRCVVKPSARKKGSLKRIARQFLLMWSCFGTRIIRDMTLQSAPSFGSFHLLHLMFDDYVLHLVESLYNQEKTSDLLRSIRGEPALGDTFEDAVLPITCAVGQTYEGGGYMSYSPPTVTTPPPPRADRQSVIMNSTSLYDTPVLPRAESLPTATPQPSPTPCPSLLACEAQREGEVTSPAHTQPMSLIRRLDADGTASDAACRYNRYTPTTTVSCTNQPAMQQTAHTSNYMYSNAQCHYASRGDFTSESDVPHADWTNGDPSYNSEQQQTTGYETEGFRPMYYYGSGRTHSESSIYAYGGGSHASSTRAQPALSAQQSATYPQQMYHSERTVSAMKREHDELFNRDMPMKRVALSGYDYGTNNCYPRA